ESRPAKSAFIIRKVSPSCSAISSAKSTSKPVGFVSPALRKNSMGGYEGSIHAINAPSVTTGREAVDVSFAHVNGERISDSTIALIPSALVKNLKLNLDLIFISCIETLDTPRSYGTNCLFEWL